MCISFDVDAFRIRRRSPKITSYRDLLAVLRIEPPAVLLALVLTALVLVDLVGAESFLARHEATAGASLEAPSRLSELIPLRRSRRFARK